MSRLITASEVDLPVVIVKLEHPLSNLIGRCQTLCGAECCGKDAFDFSPINIAAFLCANRGLSDKGELEILNGQLSDIGTKYGRAREVTVEEMNQIFTGEELVKMLAEIRANTTIALELIEISDARRVKPENWV